METRRAPVPAKALLRTVLVAGVLALAAACGGGGEPGGTTTPAAPTTPEGVAAAFASAYAGGDTPTACTYATGYALQRLNVGGAAGSLCSKSSWAPQQYNVVAECDAPAADYPGEKHSPARFWWVYGLGDGTNGFMIEVSGADRAWTVTNYAAGTAAVAGQICYPSTR